MPVPEHSIGRVTVRHEYRVCGPSRYGGEWDHGWRRETRDKAIAHAREMSAHPGSLGARVEHRIVETELLDVEHFDGG